MEAPSAVRAAMSTETMILMICLRVIVMVFLSGQFGLGRLGLSDRLPFSKPKVNWLLHALTIDKVIVADLVANTRPKGKSF